MPGRSDRPQGSPRDVTSVAVTTTDLVAALESNLRTRNHTVLRVTPPFSPRMRARLHRVSDGIGRDVTDAPVEIDPSNLVDGVPAYPEPDETEDRLRRAGEYTPERHRDAHLEAVAAWRRRVRDGLRDAVEFETATGPHRVAVQYLG